MTSGLAPTCPTNVFSYMHVVSWYHIHVYDHSLGKTDFDLSEEPPVKLERSQVQDEMVALFGSERQKRAFAAYKRNKVGTEALETALASAVTHAGSSQETTKNGIYIYTSVFCAI